MHLLWSHFEIPGRTLIEFWSRGVFHDWLSIWMLYLGLWNFWWLDGWRVIINKALLVLENILSRWIWLLDSLSLRTKLLIVKVHFNYFSFDPLFFSKVLLLLFNLFLLFSFLFIHHLLFELLFVFISVMCLNHRCLGQVSFLGMRESSCVLTSSHHDAWVFKVADTGSLRGHLGPCFFWGVNVWN